MATPGNTMGMGNPMPAGDGSLGSEPIYPIGSKTAKCKKEKHKKKLKESLLDIDDTINDDEVLRFKKKLKFKYEDVIYSNPITLKLSEYVYKEIGCRNVKLGFELNRTTKSLHISVDMPRMHIYTPPANVKHLISGNTEKDTRLLESIIIKLCFNEHKLANMLKKTIKGTCTVQDII